MNLEQTYRILLRLERGIPDERERRACCIAVRNTLGDMDVAIQLLRNEAAEISDGLGSLLEDL